jgi:cutinase
MDRVTLPCRSAARLFKIAAAAVCAAALFAVGPAPLASAACPDVEVVFARGTAEPPGLGRVGYAFLDALRTQIAPRSVIGYGVNYAANRNFLNIGDGAADVNGRVQYMADTCPNTRMVLGGYSQGAAVIDVVGAAPVGGIGLGAPLAPPLADRVAAVAVFGNPANRLAGPLSATSPLFGYKAIDLCNGADPVCADGRDVSAHSLYVQSGMTNQAASFVARLL